MGDISQDTYDLMEKFLGSLSENLRQWAEYELKKAQTKSEFKKIMKMLSHITKDGEPCIHGIPAEAQNEKDHLFAMIRQYNKEHPASPIVVNAQIYKNDVTINGVVHKAGSSLLYCNKRDYELIAEFNKQIFAMKDINIQEISNERFMDKNLNEEATQVSNISANEMNLLKTRPWAHDSYDEAIKNLSFSFSSVAKKDASYDIYVNANDNVGRSNVLKLYENLALSKALLSGPDGQIKNQQMDYERDLLKHAMNVAKGPRTDKVIYLTSAVDSGRYMVIESGKLKVYETGFSLKNFCGRKTLEISLNDAGMTGKAFSAEVTNLIKSFKNPVMLPSINDCAIHCKTGEVVKECLDSKGNTMIYPALTSEMIKDYPPEKKCDFLQNIFEIAKYNLDSKNLTLSGKNFTTECSQILKTLNRVKNDVQLLEVTDTNINKLEKELNALESKLKELENELEKDADTQPDTVITDKIKELKESLERENQKRATMLEKRDSVSVDILNSQELTTAEKIRMLITENPQCGIDSPGFISGPGKSNFENAIESIMSVNVSKLEEVMIDIRDVERDSKQITINETFVDNIRSDTSVDTIKQHSNTERLEWEYDNFDSFSDILSEEIQDIEHGSIIPGTPDKDANFDIELSEEELEEQENDNPMLSNI